MPMTYAILLTSALLAVVLAVALVREHPMRRALERLLKKLISIVRKVSVGGLRRFG